MTHTKQTWDLSWSLLLNSKFLKITLIYSAFPMGTFSHTSHHLSFIQKTLFRVYCVRSLQALDMQRLRRHSSCPKETHKQWKKREREIQGSLPVGERGNGKGPKKWQSVLPGAGGADSTGREWQAIKDCFLEETLGNFRKRGQRE